MKLKTALMALTALTLPMAAIADTDYPTRPIEIVVPFAAGGTTDVVARMIGEHLSAAWGQPVVINNMPGGGSTIGTSAAAAADPDGYTLLASTITFTINATLRQDVDFDALADFAPVIQIASVPLMVVAPAALQADSIDELIALAEANPGELNYASSGVGTSPHLAAELFKSRAGVDIMHIPFGGNAPVVTALLGEHVDLHFGLVPGFLQHVQSGDMKALAVTTAERHEALPDVPTLSETEGLEDLVISSWQGIWAPAGTPPEIVEKLNAELRAMLADPGVRERIESQGASIVASTHEEFAEFVEAQVRTWAEVIETAGIDAEN